METSLRYFQIQKCVEKRPKSNYWYYSTLLCSKYKPRLEDDLCRTCPSSCCHVDFFNSILNIKGFPRFFFSPLEHISIY